MDTPRQSAEAASPALECATEILETMPLIMGSLRHEMRREQNALTMVQFRVLSHLARRKTASLSQMADHLGLGLPSTSKVVDGLVNADWLVRRPDPADRRRISLELSEAGGKEVEATRRVAQGHLARLLTPLSVAERARLVEAMRSLRPLLPGCVPKPAADAVPLPSQPSQPS